jgi:hypothetical protein
MVAIAHDQVPKLAALSAQHTIKVTLTNASQESSPKTFIILDHTEGSFIAEGGVYDRDECLANLIQAGVAAIKGGKDYDIVIPRDAVNSLRALSAIQQGAFNPSVNTQ